MTLDDVFSNIDSELLTESVKRTIEDIFKEKVNEKVNEIVSEKLNDIEADNIAYRAYLDEQYSGQENYLNEKVNEYSDYVSEEMNNKISEYLDRVVEDFVKEAADTLVENVDHAQAQALTEAFSNFVRMTGAEVLDIVESRDETSLSGQLNAQIEQNNELVNENIKLNRKIVELQNKTNEIIKTGIINELCEGLTYSEERKFVNIAESIPFTCDGSYYTRLQDIVESVKEDKNEPETKQNFKTEYKIEDSNERVDESFSNSARIARFIK